MPHRPPTPASPGPFDHASPDLSAFVASLSPDPYWAWHDGLEYDLAALRRLTSAEERETAFRMVVDRPGMTFADLQVFEILGDTHALAMIRRYAERAPEPVAKAARAMLAHFDPDRSAQGKIRPPMIAPLTSAVALQSATLRIRPAKHAFSPAEQAAIDAGFAADQAANPRLWNGSAVLFDRIDLLPSSGDAGPARLEAEGALTDYASFLHWRRQGPDGSRFAHIVPVGAIVTADAKLILGRMSGHTANPGMLYPPAGSFDASDLVRTADGGGILDPLANIAREIREEIGLEFRSLSVIPGTWLFPSGPRSRALVTILRSPATEADLAPGIRRHIADDPHQELDDVLFIRIADGRAPVDSAPYVHELLAYLGAAG